MARDFTTLTSSKMYPLFVQETKAALLAARVWKHTNAKVTAPVQLSLSTDVSQREARVYNKNQEQALDGKGAHDAWELLGTTHVTKMANHQYQLYQELANTRQQPKEALPAYL
ncbi:hypothetical protein M407DRAFT_19636 [Tulasnella calospora MUT 4182]|uniref:Uncharacterized protein n=1 Tax=Tulasnella calospora MUT 4182 TaxID=1051891 RepID=A0A0C3QHE8_9AGAM|nr:hypothetical protein M407DRAFT_19636 [Tulasnella calospora MUT 4182]